MKTEKPSENQIPKSKSEKRLEKKEGRKTEKLDFPKKS